MPFLASSWLSLLVILAIGAITSYEDIKFGKIRNKYILFGFITGVFTNLLYVYFGGGLLYLKATIINAFFALFVGFFLWHIQLWTAGDGKLFFVFSLLVPLTEFSRMQSTMFASYVLLTNTFIPLFIVLFMRIIHRTSNTEKKKAFKFMTDPYKIVQTTVALFGFVWLLSLPLSVLKIPSNYFINIILLFITMDILGKLSEKYLNTSIGRLSIIFVFLRFIFEFKIVATIHFAVDFVSIVLSYIFLRQFVLRLGYYGTSVSVRIDNLKEGMVPVEKLSLHTSTKKKRYQKEEMFFTDIMSMLNKGTYFIFDRDAKGLTKEQIKKIQKLHSSNKLDFDNILVSETMPFAPFMFVGALMTFFAGGSILVYLSLLFL